MQERQGLSALVIDDEESIREGCRQALEAGGLSYSGNLRVRHILDVVVNDVGYEKIAAAVTRKLEGLKVAPYYGCQIVRPEMGFDDPDEPTSMDKLIEALGATSVEYSLKTKCCGASLMGTEEKLALRLCRGLLANAEEEGAHCIITLCPLCHMNLDVYQGKVNRLFGTKYKIPILYFSQLIGLALDIPFKQLGLDKLTVKVTKEMRQLIEGARDV